MTRHGETADGQPTEQSPLLIKTGNADEQRGTYISIAAASPEGTLNGTEDSASVKSGPEDEESLSHGNGEVEEGIGGSHVARIISVLLIGLFSPCPLLSSNSQGLTTSRHLCRPRRWIYPPGHTSHHRVRIQRPGEFELADHQLYAGRRCHSDSGKHFPSVVFVGELTWWKYGKLSDIYGRKILVTSAYVIFVVGW
jgi:hypothetical protein